MAVLIPLLVVAALAAFGGLAWLIIQASLKAKRARHERWDRMAGPLGLVVVPLPESGFALANHLAEMTGSLHGQPFLMREVLRARAGQRAHNRSGRSMELGEVRFGTGSHHPHRHRSGDAQGTGLVISLETAPHLSAELQVSKENVLHRVIAPLKRAEAQLGDEALDAALYFKHLPDADREVLLRPEIREALLRLAATGGSLDLRGGKLQLDFVRVPGDERIEELLLDLASLAEGLAGRGSRRGSRW